MDELEADVEALDESMAELDETVERIATVAEDEDAEVGEDDLARAWFDSLVEHRIKALLLADLRWELAERQEATGEGASPELAGLDERLDRLEDRQEDLGDRLDDLTRVAWVRRHASDLSAIDRELANQEPPVDWQAVGELVEAHRAGGEEDG